MIRPSWGSNSRVTHDNPYHNRNEKQNERWMAHAHLVKLRHGVEEKRTPGLNQWITKERSLKHPLK